MPTYEYQCDECGHGFEKFQSITAAACRKCPQCGKLRLRRLIGQGAGIIFRGSGFYQTDYRGSDYTKQAKAGSTDSAAAAKSDAGAAADKGSSGSSATTKSPADKAAG